jgi:hypothetical protein
MKPQRREERRDFPRACSALFVSLRFHCLPEKDLGTSRSFSRRALPKHDDVLPGQPPEGLDPFGLMAHDMGDFFTKDQQAMVREIFLGLHSRQYAETVFKQVEHGFHGQPFQGGVFQGIADGLIRRAERPDA